MDNDRIDRMRASRAAPAVALQEYNNLRSKIPGKLIFSFEGFEDVIYYWSVVEKIKFSAFVNCFRETNVVMRKWFDTLLITISMA